MNGIEESPNKSLHLTAWAPFVKASLAPQNSEFYVDSGRQVNSMLSTLEGESKVS